MASQVVRRRRPAIIIAVVVVTIILADLAAFFFTDVLWFDEVGFSSVLWTSLRTQFLVGLAVGLFVAAVLWVNLWIARRVAPVYRVTEFDRIDRPDPIDRYRDLITPFAGWATILVAAVVGFFSGIVASRAWETYLLFANRVPFGVSDPQFGQDVGFYVFQLPFLDKVSDWVWGALMAALIFSLAAHYVLGSIRPQRGLNGVSPKALAHVSVLLGLLALVKAYQYYLGTFQLNFSPRGVVTGASYTDVHAQLPALRVLIIISFISAVLFLVNIRFRTLALPLAAVGIWILFSILAGGAWPWWVQRFSVDPQELQRESPFIQRNIEATRAAFDLEKVETQPFAASSDLEATDLVSNEPVLQNVRLWDPGVLMEAFQQLQAIRTYYDFLDVDIDRYTVSGEPRQVLLSPRELSVEDLEENSRTWSNVHLQFTHGYGLVASLANEITSAGQPDFLVKDVPGTVDPGAESLALEQPSLYFGESFQPDEYSVVNSDQQEIDYPKESGVQRSRYAGEGGIPVGNFFKRVAFAIREGDPNLVLSGLITGDSKILIYKNVRDRVLRAAPFLSLDQDPYIAVVDGRPVWILDGFTTSNFYPYSQRFNLSDIVGSTSAGGLRGRVNYIRNSVKVTVDAYDGNLKFYVIDDSDPVIAAWRNAFPSLFTDEEPPADLQAHYRYPEDLFKAQSDVFLTYHMTDAADFYSKEDVWAVPNQDDIEIAPTYLLIELPGETGQEFVLSRPFTPRSRSNMIALMLARSDPGVYGELRTLQFPRQKQVPGPAQINSLVNQDVEISQTLTLLRQEGSDVAFGSLVTLPIEDTILYIQPLFVTAESVGIPELKRVVVVFGEEVAMEETFDEALREVFGLTAAPEPNPEPTPTPTETPGGGGEPGGGQARDLERIISAAGRVYEQAQEALSDGDFARYGVLIERLGRLLQQAEALANP